MIDKQRSTIDDQQLTTNKQGSMFNNEPSRHQVKVTQRTKKQRYIQRYGLLPTITPLLKRYGRMKRQQQQQQQHHPSWGGLMPPAGTRESAAQTSVPATGPSAAAASAHAAANGGRVGNNARK